MLPCAQDVTLTACRTRAISPVPEEQTVIIMLLEAPISPTIAKSLDTRGATPSRWYWAICLFPFFFIRTLHFLSPLSSDFFSSKKNSLGYSESEKAVVSVACQPSLCFWNIIVHFTFSTHLEKHWSPSHAYYFLFTYWTWYCLTSVRVWGLKVRFCLEL